MSFSSGVEMSMWEKGGDGKQGVPVYCHIFRYLYLCQFQTTVSYVEQ